MEVGAFPPESRGRNAVYPSPDDPFQTALELGLGSPSAQLVSDDGKGAEGGPDSGVSPAAMEEGFNGACEGDGEGSARGAVPGQVPRFQTSETDIHLVATLTLIVLTTNRCFAVGTRVRFRCFAENSVMALNQPHVAIKPITHPFTLQCTH